MSEFFPPQATPPVDHGEELRRIFTVDQEVVDIYRPQMQAIVGRTITSMVDPGRRHAAQLYAGILDWQAFGRPGDPLPDGLLMYGDGDEVTIARNAEIPYVTSKMAEALDFGFDRYGMKTVGGKIIDSIIEKSPEMSDVLADIAKQSAEYKLLASFDQPEQTRREQPLNAYWRTVRESQITQEVRSRFGYNPTEAIVAGSRADQDLRRQLYRLDDERQWQISSPESSRSGLERARAYLRPFLLEGINLRYDNTMATEIIDIRYDEDYESMLVAYRKADGSDGDTELWDCSPYAAIALNKRLHTGPEDLRCFNTEFAEQAFDEIFKHTSRNLQEALKNAMANYIDYTEDALFSIFPGHAGRELQGGQSDYEVAIRAPRGTVVRDRKVPERDWGDTAWRNAFPYRAEFGTRDELQAGELATRGIVERYGPSNCRVAARLILSRVCETSAAETFTGEEDLIIRLYDHDGSTEPLIPGYKLLYKSKNMPDRFAFELDRSGDQYALCTVPVNKQRREQLIESYAALGLHGLATKIAGFSRMTVTELVDAIREESVYHLPTRLTRGYEQGDALDKSYTETESLADFKALVDDGKLVVQCTGSALFLQYSLEAVFSDAGVGILGGHTIKAANRRINGNDHAQTVFTYRGKQYILDATPAVNLGYGSGDGGYHATNRKPTRAPVLANLNLEKPEPETPAFMAKAPKTKAERLDDILTSFMDQARVAFNMPNEQQLKKFLVSLPPQDPARRMHELIRQYRAGRINDEQLEKQSNYVVRCPDTPPNIRRQLRIDHYSQRFLEQLRSAAWHLQYIGTELK